MDRYIPLAPAAGVPNPFFSALKITEEEEEAIREALNSDPNAWPPGTRVEKTASEPRDSMEDGAGATVIASLSEPTVYDGLIMYIVEFDAVPGVPVWCGEWKLRRI